MEPIRVFIGYDKREASAYHVCQQSIIENCSEPNRLQFTPITGEQRDGSNAFIYARFLVPHYCGFKGSAIFLDGDMVVMGDITELWERRHALYVGCSVVPHDYQTKHPVKYLGYPNKDYPRKNWSSVIVWNCDYYPNRVLTPKFVQEATGEYLHRFQWLKDDQIGLIPDKWNRLVLEQEIQPDDKLLHYTIGIPAFQEYADCDGAEHWWKTYRNAFTPITE
jgi:hypothetical protein